MVCCCESGLDGTLIFTVVIVAARHDCQSQQAKTNKECQKCFHRTNVGKKNCQFKTKLSDGTGVVGQNQNVLQKRVGLWVALQLSLFCEGIVKRLCRKLHCPSGFVCRLMVALSGFRVADNVLQLPEGRDFYQKT